MYLQHWVRFGALGHLGRFVSVDGTRYGRKARVVCRTPRGLEIGEVLGATPDFDQSVSAVVSGKIDASESREPDGQILRAVTVQDDLLLARIERNRQQAIQECEKRLAEKNIEGTLADVEHLFDGQTLVFYFIGTTSDEIQQVTEELAEAYEANVQFRAFTETMTQGCGPGCGTEEAASGGGCGSGGGDSGGCGTCLIAQACGTRRSG